jgi:hypothetical protein
MPALVFPETPTEGELFPTVNPRWQWVSNRWAPIGIFTGNSTLPLGTYVLWPTADLGSIPDGFLVADGTEGTEDMTADAIGELSFIVRSNGQAPTLVSATIGTDGETWTLVWSEPVTGTLAGMAGDATGGAVTLTLASGGGTDTWTATGSRVVIDTETVDLDYTPGDIEDAIGNQLAAFANATVTNNSTQTGASPTPVFVTAVGSNFGTTRSPVIDYPTATANHIWVLFITTDNTHDTNGTPPSGWTKLGSTTAGTDSSSSAFWKRATGSEGASETWTDIFSSNSSGGRAILMVYSGCVTTGSPFDDVVFEASGTSYSNPSIGITTTVPNVRLLAMFGCDPGADPYTFTWTSPATERIDSDTTPTGQNALLSYITAADREAATADTYSMGGTSSNNDVWNRFIFALKP